MTLTLQNIKSLKHALETINKFCIHAGSKVNISKTECIALGPFKNMFTEIEGISVTNKAVKCLGIHVGHDKIECYNKNWRLQNIVETSEGIVCNLKLCIQKYLEILFKTLLDKL